MAEKVDKPRELDGRDDNKDNDLVPLKPKISLFNGVTIIVGSIIGSGIFNSPGLLTDTKWVGSAMLVWIFCGIFSMVGALYYGELGSTMITMSRGDYVAYIYKAFGSLSEFLLLWVTVVVIRPTAQTIDALTFGNYLLQPFFPDSETPIAVFTIPYNETDQHAWNQITSAGIMLFILGLSPHIYRVAFRDLRVAKHILPYLSMTKLVLWSMLMLMVSPTHAAALGPTCLPTCVGDYYCFPLFRKWICRNCEITCANSNDRDECDEHCMESQYYPDEGITTKYVASTAGEETNATISTFVTSRRPGPGSDLPLTTGVGTTIADFEGSTASRDEPDSFFQYWAFFIFVPALLMLVIILCLFKRYSDLKNLDSTTGRQYELVPEPQPQPEPGTADVAASSGTACLDECIPVHPSDQGEQTGTPGEMRPARRAGDALNPEDKDDVKSGKLPLSGYPLSIPGFIERDPSAAEQEISL